MSTPNTDRKNAVNWEYLRWNSLISEKHKLLYVATPKVACTSLKWWFVDLMGISRELFENADSAETDPDLIIHDSLFNIAPYLTGLEAQDLRRIFNTDTYFRFALVRNPYKRIFSAWQSKLLLREPIQAGPYLQCDFFHRPINNATDIVLAFEGFLEHLYACEAPNFLDFHWTPQATLLRPDSLSYTLLSHIENVEKLSKALSEYLGPQIPNPFTNRRVNESLIPYMPEFFSPRSAQLIQTLYREDFEAFEYPIELPDAKEAFSAQQLAVAIQAIHLIRGRHRRISEISRTFEVKIDKALNDVSWISRQSEAWQEQTTNAKEQVYFLEARLKEMEMSNAWLQEQRDSWEKTANTQKEHIQALETAHAEMRAGNTWLQEQRDAWEKTAKAQEEHAQSITVELDEIRAGNTWLQEQRDAWEKAAKAQEEHAQSLKVQLEEMQTSNAWLQEQLDSWEKTAKEQEEHAQSITVELDGMRAGNTWLQEQRDRWEKAARAQEEHAQLLKVQLEEMQTSNAWLQEQRDSWMKAAKNHEDRALLLNAQHESILARERLLLEQRDIWQQKAEILEEQVKWLKAELDRLNANPLFRFLFRIKGLATANSIKKSQE
jgi:hypothetical protein